MILQNATRSNNEKCVVKKEETMTVV